MSRIRLFFVLLFLSFYTSELSAQNACAGHPHFTALANHSVAACKRTEFDVLKIYKREKNGSTAEFDKKGELVKIDCSYSGDWNTRPSYTQIYQNDINAIKRFNGTVLYAAPSLLCVTYKAGNSIFWTQVSTDGSGYYTVVKLTEASMRQDVILKADDIRNLIKEDGKAVFYDFYFDIDKSVLKPGAEEALKEVALFLKANPSLNFFVVGHTYNTGSQDYNVQLSRSRALAVVNELVMKYEVRERQLEVHGVGCLSPVSTNKTEEGRAKNRRVELVPKN
jgi:outer membrane protein OmpA-like peptidoglycan-associated protein